MKRFLILCSGADPSILAECPTEMTKYAGIGATILFTALLAALSGGYALYTVFDSVAVALPFACLWALMIFNLDRVIISGMRKQSSFRRDLAFASPRLVLAVLLAVVISKPLELRLFQSEIAAQMKRTANEQYLKVLHTIDQGYGEVDALKKEDGDLAVELSAKQDEVKQLYQAAADEEGGTGGTGRRGNGPVAKRKSVMADAAKAQLAAAEPAIVARRKAIRERLDQLESERKPRITQALADQKAANGFLARIKALSDLGDADPAVLLASWFVMLLLIALETAPVAVKLLSNLSPFRPYEQLLEDREWEIAERSQAFRATTAAALQGRRETEIHVRTTRNQQQAAAELGANAELMTKIAAAQGEIAGLIVEKWKNAELDKVATDPASYVNVQ